MIALIFLRPVQVQETERKRWNCRNVLFGRKIHDVVGGEWVLFIDYEQSIFQLLHAQVFFVWLSLALSAKRDRRGVTTISPPSPLLPTSAQSLIDRLWQDPNNHCLGDYENFNSFKNFAPISAIFFSCRIACARVANARVQSSPRAGNLKGAT